MTFYDDYDQDRWADAQSQEAEDRAEYELAVAQHLRDREAEDDYRDRRAEPEDYR